jgi:hypothetical protein
VRVVSWFSCGAASAVATKLAIAQYGAVDIVRCYVAEEHPDNERFAADCEAWFGQPITTLRNEKYSSSAYEVVRQRGFWSGPGGAPCTRILKREAREAYQRPTDKHILGYTADAIDVKRWGSFLDANNIDAEAPLIDRGVTHSDCLAMIQRAGIRLPVMYLLGFAHNNCIGCTKAGGQGYWNKVRVHFPDRFREAMAITNKLGARPLMVNGTRVGLDELDENAGEDDSAEVQCGIFCHLAEQEIASA